MKVAVGAEKIIMHKRNNLAAGFSSSLGRCDHRLAVYEIFDGTYALLQCICWKGGCHRRHHNAFGPPRKFAQKEQQVSLFRRKNAYEVDVGEAIDAWGDTVMRVAHRYMGSMSDAEDVFQTVFMRLLKSKPRISDEEHLKAWLIRVTLNCCYDELRKRQPTFELNEDSAIAQDEELSLSKTSLEQAIESLVPPIRRTVIYLYYYEGYTTNEIAKIIGEKPATVRSHLHRARNALRISLEGASDE